MAAGWGLGVEGFGFFSGPTGIQTGCARDLGGWPAATLRFGRSSGFRVTRGRKSKPAPAPVMLRVGFGSNPWVDFYTRTRTRRVQNPTGPEPAGEIAIPNSNQTALSLGREWQKLIPDASLSCLLTPVCASTMHGKQSTGRLAMAPCVIGAAVRGQDDV